jgi:hypothetical protein
MLSRESLWLWGEGSVREEGWRPSCVEAWRPSRRNGNGREEVVVYRIVNDWCRNVRLERMRGMILGCGYSSYDLLWI